MEMCGIPANRLEQFVEQLRESHSVTISPLNTVINEHTAYSMPKLEQAESVPTETILADETGVNTPVSEVKETEASNPSPVAENQPQMRTELTQEDIDEALRRWNGSPESKRAVVRYMQDHARERDTAAWLAGEYGTDVSKPLHITLTGTDIDHVMPWPKVQRRIAQLIKEDRFFTEQERDNFDDIDPIAIREALEQRGIVDGQVVDPEKLDRDPFIRQVTADVERIAQEEQAQATNLSGLQAPPYKVGDTVYLDNTAFEITAIRQFDVELRDPALAYPIFRAENKARFEIMLHQDPRNSGITEYLAQDLKSSDSDLQEVLARDGGLLSQQDKDQVARWFHAGESNTRIAQRLADTYAGRADTMMLQTGEGTDYFATAAGLEINIDDKYSTKHSFSWLEVARVLRAMYVDEAHSFKNLFLYTKMRNVAGLSTTDAQKSSDMLLKCRYIDEITGGRGVVFATGTPVSNSMTELYTMMRYLQHDTISAKGLSHFDCWASTFGETTTAIELAPEGTGYRARTRFAKFFNLPELMTLFKEAADIKTADQLHLPTPTPIYHNEVAQPTEIQQEMVQELSKRAAAVHAGLVDASQDNMLKITSDGRKLGLDQRVINPDLPDDPSSKVNTCVGNIFRIWKEGQADKLTQLVFCDLSTPKVETAKRVAKTAGGKLDSPELHAVESQLIRDGIGMEAPFSIYDDIRSKLVAMGIPREQIAFIHEANTEARKKELFAKVRSGQVRVLMGSTFKMGAGMNVQDRLIALHDLDAPWRPGDLEQRSGRIIRQGNRNKEVHIYRYVTEGTFDAYLWVRHEVA